MAILISDKIDFKSKPVIRDKEEQSDKNTNLPGRFDNCKYICAPNNTALQYMKQTLTELKGKIESNSNSRRLKYSTFNNG